MPKKKLSDQALVALVEDLITKAPHEFDGFLWAAWPQSYYFEALGISQWKLIERIKKPPFVARTTKIDGKVVCLLRIGEPAPKVLNDYKKIMRSMLRNMRDNAKPPILYGTAGEDDAVAKAATKAAKSAKAEGEDAVAAAAIAADEAGKKFKAEARKEDQMLWGFAKEVVALAAWANSPWPNFPSAPLPKDIEERLVLRSFKYALSKEGWPFVASAIKIAQESLGDKLTFLEYPSHPHIRRYWFAVVNAYVTDDLGGARGRIAGGQMLSLLHAPGVDADRRADLVAGGGEFGAAQKAGAPFLPTQSAARRVSPSAAVTWTLPRKRMT